MCRHYSSPNFCIYTPTESYWPVLLTKVTPPHIILWIPAKICDHVFFFFFFCFFFQNMEKYSEWHRWHTYARPTQGHNSGCSSEYGAYWSKDPLIDSWQFVKCYTFQFLIYKFQLNGNKRAIETTGTHNVVSSWLKTKLSPENKPNCLYYYKNIFLCQKRYNSLC